MPAPALTPAPPAPLRSQTPATFTTLAEAFVDWWSEFPDELNAWADYWDSYTPSGGASSGDVGSSGLTMATSRILGRVTASTGAVEELTAAQVKTLLALVIGTDVQAYDADLAAIAGLTTTSYGRSLLTLANQAALQAEAGGGGGSFPNRAFYNTATNTNSVATIPLDGTIPQITEGEAVFDADLTITPSSVTSRIRVEVDLQLGSIGAGGQWALAALFLNGGANAVEVKAVFCTTGGAAYTARLIYEWVPGSTSVQTLHTRYGPALAGTSSLLPSNNSLGGVCKCSITATEVA